MNCRQVIDSDESMPKSLTTKKAAKKDLQTDTGSNNDLNSGDESGPEEGASSQVSDFLHLLLRIGVDIATKVENYRRCLKYTTKDLHICGKDGKGSHPFKNTSVEGWYCKFCL